jgi:hypothetical protein
MIRKLDATERELPPLLPPADDPVAIEQHHKREEQSREIRQRDVQPVLDELQ